MPTNNTKTFSVNLGFKPKKSPSGNIDFPTSITFIDMGKTVMGNKRVLFADIVLGDGVEVWSEYGVSLTPQNFGLVGINAIIFSGGQAQYVWDKTNKVINAYVCGTAGASNVFVEATGATINETVRCMVIGFGMQP
jgi:hypothetical protein